jgi:hypothetical protein
MARMGEANQGHDNQNHRDASGNDVLRHAFTPGSSVLAFTFNFEPEGAFPFAERPLRLAGVEARPWRGNARQRGAPSVGNQVEIEESVGLRTLGARKRGTRMETFTLIVDGLGITLFGTLIYLDGRRARGRRPSS